MTWAMRMVQNPHSTLAATKSIRSEMPMRMSGITSGVYTSAWWMVCSRSRQRWRASAEVVPITQETRVESPATVRDSQKLCISAFTE